MNEVTGEYYSPCVLSLRDLRTHDEKNMKMLLIGALVTSNLTRGLSLKAGTLLFVGGNDVVWREYVPAT